MYKWRPFNDERWKKRKPQLQRLRVSVKELMEVYRGSVHVPRAPLDLQWLFQKKVMTAKKLELECYCPCERVKPMPGGMNKDRCAHCDKGL